MIQQTEFSLISSSGKPVRGNVHLPAQTEGAPVAVFCHGFKGFKDWGAFPLLMDTLATDGWVAVRFNFSLNGIGEDPFSFTEFESFERNTYSQELEDLEMVIDAVARKLIVPAQTDTSRLALIGHSRGGGIVLTKAGENPLVGAVAALAPMCIYYRWGEKTKEEWRRTGFIEVTNARTNQVLKMGIGLLQDVERNLDRFDLAGTVSRMQIPALMIHGEQDATITIEEAQGLYAVSNHALMTMETIPNTDHTFGIRHPFDGTTPQFERMVALLLPWLKANTRPRTD